MTYTHNEESGYSGELSATTLEGAITEAEELLRGGSWGQDQPGFAGATVEAYITDDDGDTVAEVAVELPPDEPPCSEGDEHEWTSEGEGGCDENPGVWSHGGTTIVTSEHCSLCGMRRIRTSHGSQRDHGESDTTEYYPQE